MFGTIEYFTNHFKTCIMNNFIMVNPCTLRANYSMLTDEIVKIIDNPEEKERYLSNIEKAFKKINEDLFELEEE